MSNKTIEERAEAYSQCANYELDNQMQDNVVEQVRQDLFQRSQRGIDKYGTTLDREDLSLKEWLQHAYEESLDKALYLKRAIQEL